MRGTKRNLFKRSKNIHYKEYRRKVEEKLVVNLEENSEWQDGFSMLKENEKKEEEFVYDGDNTSFSDIEVYEMRRRNKKYDGETLLKETPRREHEDLWLGEDWRLRWKKDIFEDDTHTGIYCNSWTESELNDFQKRLRRGDKSKAILMKRELDLKDTKRKLRRRPHERYRNYFKFTDALGFTPRKTFPSMPLLEPDWMQNS